jgi:hypothetical protein
MAAAEGSLAIATVTTSSAQRKRCEARSTAATATYTRQSTTISVTSRWLVFWLTGGFDTGMGLLTQSDDPRTRIRRTGEDLRSSVQNHPATIIYR